MSTDPDEEIAPLLAESAQPFAEIAPLLADTLADSVHEPAGRPAPFPFEAGPELPALGGGRWPVGAILALAAVQLGWPVRMLTAITLPCTRRAEPQKTGRA